VVLFRSALIFDGDSEHLRRGDVLGSGDVISDILYDPCESEDDLDVVDCDGKVLMPGFIDATFMSTRQAQHCRWAKSVHSGRRQFAKTPTSFHGSARHLTRAFLATAFGVRGLRV